MTKTLTPTTGNALSSELLDKLCEDVSCRAACLESALEALIVPLEHAELWGLAYLLELIVKEAGAVCSDVAEIPRKSKVVDHG